MATVNNRLRQDRTSSEVDYRTPPEIFEGLNSRFGPYTLDVAASSENSLCFHYYDKAKNALGEVWYGNVWCNPPYNKIQPWVEHGLNQIQGYARSITFLVPASTCTQWFKMLWESKYTARIIFITGRLSFRGPHIHPEVKAASANPSMVVVLNRDNQGLARIERIDRGEI
jgi:phage N-6-adenine-methyltransferase